MLNPPVNNKIQRLFKAFECFQVLFKANLIFKDFSRQTCIFKYFSSLCKPCIRVCTVCLLKPNQCLEKELQYLLKIIICDPPIYTTDHPDFIVEALWKILLVRKGLALSWHQGYKTFFMLNSTEHEISTAHKKTKIPTNEEVS